MKTSVECEEKFFHKIEKLQNRIKFVWLDGFAENLISIIRRPYSVWVPIFSRKSVKM